MVLNHIYYRKNAKGGIEYFWPQDVDNVTDAKGAIVGATLKADGSAVQYGGIGTMSKSKNNGVDPQSLIDSMGADTARLFVMFASPPEQTLEWSDSGVDGAHRFLRRLWAVCYKLRQTVEGALSAGNGHGEADDASRGLLREVNQLLKQADYDYQRIQYNTVVSTCMKMLNAIDAAGNGGKPAGAQSLCEALSVLIRVLYPVVPHITWQIWRDLGFEARYGDLLDAPWPEVDEKALVADEIELVLQVNGKLRGSITVEHGAEKAHIEALARAHEATVRFLEGRDAKRVIVVPGKLVNVVG
jgi:leucyl-tRNA synthetase